MKRVLLRIFGHLQTNLIEYDIEISFLSENFNSNSRLD
ncbi:hypothetical protein LEP1GSC016_2974 [Leptospira borgpetersenii serovar Hardjo-bovis str. Sponselee]|uniref:Uncharacterized protein n=7 Tax=Leptospira borgpetersenii TaxID=174 RepID=M3FBW5_LEPBO|nr:hypothetical protein LBBP_00317 [Leptospira borgpetersenii serovar Ballum]EKP13194.1 hypothetical protein LEP1GSC128_3297 [Leptospira borgpetersenii str. 200801926]EKQ98948.1 hypothetical protein LEP1GSC121_0578 [Leptospira borgpetersenii serovar Castellonis str. 200801910]EMF99377.1 hypothetical protein LEP1GSC123_4641 [Leptospira borgpetersenii str. 200701203]EMJ80084.1 hypothetical protein LEP1GSC016_2974 [Leptospira borgpetersenii serovar Hardjo-bovis str. Sponselee]EMK13316.1 hypotheti